MSLGRLVKEINTSITLPQAVLIEKTSYIYLSQTFNVIWHS